MSEKNCKCCPAKVNNLAKAQSTTRTTTQNSNLKTSDLYKTTNIPFRFEHPGKL